MHLQEPRRERPVYDLSMIADRRSPWDATLRLVLAAGAALVGVHAPDATVAGPRSGGVEAQPTAPSAWHADARQGFTVDVRPGWTPFEGDAGGDGDRHRGRTERLPSEHDPVAGAVGVACGAVTLAIHLRKCGHLSDRLDLPPPLLS